MASSIITNGGPGFYVNASLDRSIPVDRRSGFGWYSSLWPLPETQFSGFQLGLSSSWIIPDNQAQDSSTSRKLCATSTNAWVKNVSEDPTSGTYGYSLMQSIEGSLGWWGGQKFPSAVPKYQPNVTQNCYTTQLATPGWGFFDGIATARNATGLIQLTNQLLLPPDGMTFKNDGGVPQLGITWFSLQFPDFNHEYNNMAGPNSWTLFLKTANYSGPIEFVAPQFWADGALSNPIQSGKTLDTLNGYMGLLSSEWASIPFYQFKDINGKTYSKLPKLSLPSDSEGNLVFSRDLRTYGPEALKSNFTVSTQKGNPLPECLESSQIAQMKLRGQSSNVFQGGEPIPSIAKTLATTEIANGTAYGLKLPSANSITAIPQYFLSQDGNRVPVPESNVPSQLVSASFQMKNTYQFVYSAPSWWAASPSASNTYSARLNDGSSVDYKWYKFVDQPALQRFNLTEVEKSKLQTTAEKIQKEWANSKLVEEPSGGKLASFDEGLFVSPPKGMEIGYVPIVTRQYFGNPIFPELNKMPNNVVGIGCNYKNALSTSFIVQTEGVGDIKWPAKCPQVENTKDANDPKVIGFTFNGTGQKFSRLENGKSSITKSPDSLVGCYVNSAGILGPSPGWQIGAISRNSNGYYWTNAAGITWGLTLKNSSLETDTRNPYFSSGKEFILDLGNIPLVSMQTPTPQPSQTSTSPTISKLKSISCVKGKILKKVYGLNPKCPTGYKLKK